MSKAKINKSIFLLLLMAVVLIATSIVLIFALQTDEVGEILENDELIRMLFVVHDNGKSVLADVLVYYPVSRRGALFDIPGNTGAIYSSLGRVDRIDEVYNEKGILAYKTEIEKLTGTTIPFTLEMSLEDFGMLSDFMGGLRVFIPYPVDFVKDGIKYLLPSGAVSLDGDKICTYLTYESPEDTSSDIQDRKQNSIVAYLSSVNQNKALFLDKKIFEIYANYMHANVDTDGLYKLFSEISNIDAERLMPQTVTGSSRLVDGKTLLFPYYDGQLIKDVFKQTTTALVSTSGTVSSRVYVLEIQNGTAVQGLARNTAALLQSAGYDVLSMINAETNDYENTVIIDHIGNSEEAKSLADFIRCENIVTDEIKEDEELEADSLVDFTIVLGKDFDGRYVR